MSSHLPFPLADFYDALVSNSLKQKLQPFIAQFKKKNIYIIFQCVNRLIQIITNKSQVPIMKFNALMATRIFFDTCQYPAIIFIEVYLLPIIYEIALEKYLKRSEEGVQMYFIDRGAQNNKQMKRLGLNYVQLANQFIFNCAKVKPCRLIQNSELKQQSNFSKVVKILKSKNILQNQKCIYYIPSYAIQTRKKYLKKLKHIASQPYISFIISEYLQEINLNKKCDLDLKKILMFGDAYITSTMINIIETELEDMSHNFVNKKKFVNLLNQLVRSGDVEAVILLNSSEFINQITLNLQKVRGDLNLNQGEFIYPKIEASKQQKKQFYLQFLRCLEIWAFSIPTSEDGEDSDPKLAYDNLKQKNFIFPQNVLLKKIKNEMQESLKVNEQRNQALMKIIQQDDERSIRNNGSYLSDKGQFKFKHVKPDQGLQYLQLQQLQNKVFQAKKKIARLSIKQQQLQQNMKQLALFKQSWDKLLDKLDIEDQDGHELQILLQQGDLCCEQIKIIHPIYIQYCNNKINHTQFIDKIQLFLNSEDGDQTYSNNSKKHRLKKFQNLNKNSQVSISIDNDLKSQKKLKQQNVNEISIDSKQSIVSKNKERLSNAKLKMNKFQGIKIEQAKVIEQNKHVKSISNAEKVQYNSKRPSLLNLNNSNIIKKQGQDPKKQVVILKKQYPYSGQQKVESSKKQQSNKQSAKFYQVKNQKVKFQPDQVSFNKTSSQYSEKSVLKNQKQVYKNIKQKISIIKHSVISKSSHKSEPTQQKIYFTGQQSHSMINDYEIQKNQINLKKSMMKRTQNSKCKIVGKSSREDFSDQYDKGLQQKQLKSPFKKKKSSILKPSMLNKRQNGFDRYRRQQDSQSNDGYQKVFRSKNRSSMKLNNSVISSDSQSQNKQSQKVVHKIKNKRQQHLQYYNQEVDSQYILSQKQLKNVKAKVNVNANDSSESKTSNKMAQVTDQYNMNHLSPKIIKFNQKISEISKQYSKLEQRSRPSGVKLFSKSQGKQFDKMYNKQGNIFPSSVSKDENSLLQNQSYVHQYKIKTGIQFGLKESTKQNFNFKENSKRTHKIFPNHKQIKDTDLIKEPDDFPLLNSYYSQRQFQKQYSRVDQYSDFRSCYANFQKQILPINQSHSKVVSKSFSLDKISNFIQYKKRSSKMSTMVDAISQKNAKNSILMYKLQRQKTRLIQNLQNKIKCLQNNGKFMKTKLAVKDQLKSQQSISIKQFSERQNQKTYSKGIKSQNQSQSNVSSYKEVEQKQRLNLYSKKQQQYNISSVNNLKCQLLNHDNYTCFFVQNSNKKAFLKKKGVILKNQTVQIGFMVNKKDKSVNILLFITPLKCKLNKLSFSLQTEHNLTKTLSPSKIQVINQKKQQIVNCKLNIQNIPFKTPIFVMKYYLDNSQVQTKLKLQLPCSMLSFCQFQQPSSNTYKNIAAQQALRSQMFKINKKILKLDKIHQILPYFRIQKQNKKCTKYKGKIMYNQVQIDIYLIQDSQGSMSIQASSLQNEDKKFVEFLVSTLRHLLSN